MTIHRTSVPHNTQRAIAYASLAGEKLPSIAKDEHCSLAQVVEIIERAERHAGGVIGFARQKHAGAEAVEVLTELSQESSGAVSASASP